MADSFLSKSRDGLDYKVRLGDWTNWSRGPVWGATLTLNRQQGSFLIAFTAFFVTVVATRFWRLACSILHRNLSVEEPRDDLHYQRQAVFRNSMSSLSALWSFMQITWAWRHLAQNNLSRTLPPIVFATITLLAFSFASGFSYSISTSIGDEVLIDGSDCGSLIITGTSVGDFIPAPDLRRPDADIFLFFLSGNGMISSVSLSDPWYRFDVQSAATLIPYNSDKSIPSYKPSEAASPLGCTYQVQVCKGASASNRSCGRLGSSTDAWQDAGHLFTVDTEGYTNIVWKPLVALLIALLHQSLLMVLENSAKLSKNAVQNIQGPLPDDQWKLDVTNWWNISLSALQAAFVDTAYGLSNPDVFRLQINATSSGQRSVCQNQKTLIAQYICNPSIHFVIVIHCDVYHIYKTVHIILIFI
ncbi:hypothetical protein F5B18DRAFT_672689 [Nemania serpens]|nr:hypothetical protein F5B18DRAFT_672689 [Nemania serpens]